jgi:hypothetical protein
VLAACNCDWGCPCNFGAHPTNGYCQTIYLFSVDEGHYGETSLDGTSAALAVAWPGPIWEGDATSLLICDERSTSEQREAVETFIRGRGVGMPFDVLAAMTTRWLPTITAPFEVSTDGIHTQASIGEEGRICELATSPIQSRLTRSEGAIRIENPAGGFLSTRAEIGKSSRARLHTDDLSFENSGQHAQYERAEWAGG